MKPVSNREEAKARAIVQRAQNQQAARELIEKRKLIGRCYRYLNRYSDGESWWLYSRVTSVDEHGRVLTTNVQHTSNGQIELTTEAYGGMLPNGGWREIDVVEFVAGTMTIASAFLKHLSVAQSPAPPSPEPRQET